MENDNTMHSAVSWHGAVDRLDEAEWEAVPPGAAYGHCEVVLLDLYRSEVSRMGWDVPEPGRHARARENVLACVSAMNQLHHRWTAVELRGVAAGARRVFGGWAQLGREWLEATHPGFPVHAVSDLAAVGRFARRPDTRYVAPQGDTGPVWVIPHRTT